MEKDCKNEDSQEITLTGFAKRVIKMRDAQKTYFRTRNQTALFDSKRLESEIDKIAKTASLPKQMSILDEVANQEPKFLNPEGYAVIDELMTFILDDMWGTSDKALIREAIIAYTTKWHQLQLDAK